MWSSLFHFGFPGSKAYTSLGIRSQGSPQASLDTGGGRSLTPLFDVILTPLLPLLLSVSFGGSSSRLPHKDSPLPFPMNNYLGCKFYTIITRLVKQFVNATFKLKAMCIMYVVRKVIITASLKWETRERVL